MRFGVYCISVYCINPGSRLVNTVSFKIPMTILIEIEERALLPATSFQYAVFSRPYLNRNDGFGVFFDDCRASGFTF